MSSQRSNAITHFSDDSYQTNAAFVDPAEQSALAKSLKYQHPFHLRQSIQLQPWVRVGVLSHRVCASFCLQSLLELSSLFRDHHNLDCFITQFPHSCSECLCAYVCASMQVNIRAKKGQPQIRILPTVRRIPASIVCSVNADTRAHRRYVGVGVPGTLTPDRPDSRKHETNCCALIPAKGVNGGLVRRTAWTVDFARRRGSTGSRA